MMPQAPINTRPTTPVVFATSPITVQADILRYVQYPVMPYAPGHSLWKIKLISKVKRKTRELNSLSREYLVKVGQGLRRRNERRKESERKRQDKAIEGERLMWTHECRSDRTGLSGLNWDSWGTKKYFVLELIHDLYTTWFRSKNIGEKSEANKNEMCVTFQQYSYRI
jgi:hypothetical protein